MKYRLSILCLFLSFPLFAQTEISGIVKDSKGNPVPFANVFLQEIYDGGSTDEAGKFNFTSKATGKQVLMVSAIGYKKFSKEIEISTSPIKLEVTLSEDIEKLAPVVVTAGTFEASDEKNNTILKPLDIVTTAGADGDIASAIRTLPGVMNVGNETGILVRGGEASETQTIIDGTVVRTPFYGDLPDIPQRSRFAPFDFKGTNFSTGGYSAEFGGALSSVLILETTDLPKQSSTGINLLPMTWGISHTQLINEQTSIAGSAGYTNLNPFFNIIPQLTDWTKAPEGWGGTLAFRHQGKQKDMLKSTVQYGRGRQGIRFDDLENVGKKSFFRNENDNLYINNSYLRPIGQSWTMRGNLAYSHDRQEMDISENKLIEEDKFTHAKLVFEGDLSQISSLKVGIEYQSIENHFQFSEQVNSTIHDHFGAGFAELQSKFGEKFAIQSGIRTEYSDLLGEANFATRSSMAYKTGIFSQVSLAYGTFFQRPQHEYLVQSEVNFEKARHYILNYQRVVDERTFRVEVYHKEYSQLIREEAQNQFSNEGHGFARGVDVFWRDKNSVNNLDYWVSYSFVDSKRFYRDFPELKTPTFIANHTLNFVGKYTFKGNRTSLGATYTFTSGRRYFNPNNPEFLGDKTKNFHNFNLNASYLTRIKGHFTVLFCAVNNVFNIKNEFGYRYSSDGTRRSPILPPALRSAIIGAFIQIGK